MTNIDPNVSTAHCTLSSIPTPPSYPPFAQGAPATHTQRPPSIKRSHLGPQKPLPLPPKHPLRLGSLSTQRARCERAWDIQKIPEWIRKPRTLWKRYGRQTSTKAWEDAESESGDAGAEEGREAEWTRMGRKRRGWSVPAQGRWVREHGRPLKDEHAQGKDGDGQSKEEKREKERRTKEKRTAMKPARPQGAGVDERSWAVKGKIW